MTTPVTDQRGQHPVLRVWFWLLAPFDDSLRGLSQTRILAALIFWFTWEVAHDWINAKQPLGWAFAIFCIAGMFLSAVVALGAKYVGELLKIVATKLGAELVEPHRRPVNDPG